MQEMAEEPKVEVELTEEELAEREHLRRETSLVLVGFGKHDLSEVLTWRGTPKEEDAILAPTKWPPRYRREAGAGAHVISARTGSNTDAHTYVHEHARAIEPGRTQTQHEGSLAREASLSSPKVLPTVYMFGCLQQPNL